MEAEKNLILSAFLRGVPSKEIMVFVSLGLGTGVSGADNRDAGR